MPINLSVEKLESINITKPVKEKNKNYAEKRVSIINNVFKSSYTSLNKKNSKCEVLQGYNLEELHRCNVTKFIIFISKSKQIM